MNSKRKTSGMLGMVFAFGLAGGSLSLAISESGTLQSQKSDLLLNANSLIGNSVIDQSGKELGTVKDLMIDQKTGRISYIILTYGGTFGGTLGINAENYSIPWNDVKLTKQDEKMIVEVAEAPIGEKATPSKRSFTHAQTSTSMDHNDFDPATIATFEGTVENVGHDMFESGVDLTDSLIVLDVKTSSGQERVRVAPDNYLKEQGLDIKEGDRVEVTGSRINREGKDLVLASKIVLKRNGKVLALRQDNGTPKWSMEETIHTKSRSQTQ
ncbi:MAG: PRC-barrel domain-containing protein [Nitrospirales bacterium]|nr:PRC-barrel domain-containing protein [Nitrospirales bacterium]